MVIQVNDNYHITSNASCWQVERYRGVKKDRGEYWEPLTYHADFKSSLVSLTELRIRLIDSSVPDEIVAAIKQIKDEVIASAEVFQECQARPGRVWQEGFLCQPLPQVTHRWELLFEI